MLDLLRLNSLWPLLSGLACCAMEMMSAATSVNDMDRFNMFPFRASPRQADVLIVAGTLTTKMAGPLVRLWEQMPEPKWCVAMGDCTCSGGRYKRSYATVEGIDRVMPVDVYVPGCPPRPEGLIYGMMKLQQLILERRGHWAERARRPDRPRRRLTQRPDQQGVVATDTALKRRLEDRLGDQLAGPVTRAPRHDRDRGSAPGDVTDVMRTPARRRRRSGSSCWPTCAASTRAPRCRSSTTCGRRCSPDWLRVIAAGLPREDPRVPSVTFLWKGAEWAEREAYDMFGIIFEGNRDLRRIYMPPDYVSFPLRKDFLLPDDARARRAWASATWSSRAARRDRPPGRAARSPAPAAWSPGGDRGRAGRRGRPRAGGGSRMTTEPTRSDRSTTRTSWSRRRRPSIDAVPPYPPRTEREAEFYSLRDGEMLVNLGPAAPVDPRRAARRAQDRRRARRRPRPGPRLPPPRRGEDLRERRLAPRHQQLRPARVHRLDVQRGDAGLAAEKLLDLQVPRRAEYIRVLAWELNRISSHALFIGWLALDLGGLTPILYGFIERDEIVEMLAALTGQKLLFNYLRIGGVNGDLNHDFLSRLGDWMSRAGKQHRGAADALNENEIFVRRTRGLGVARPRDRAADCASRARRCAPPACPTTSAAPTRTASTRSSSSTSRRAPRATPTRATCSTSTRSSESIHIIDQVLHADARRPDDGQAAAPAPGAARVAPGSPSRARAASTACYAMSDGSDQPFRLRIHDPSYFNLQAVGAADAGPPDRRHDGHHGQPRPDHGRGRQVTTVSVISRPWSRLTLRGQDHPAAARPARRAATVLLLVGCGSAG